MNKKLHNLIESTVKKTIEESWYDGFEDDYSMYPEDTCDTTIFDNMNDEEYDSIMSDMTQQDAINQQMSQQEPQLPKPHKVDLTGYINEAIHQVLKEYGDTKKGAKLVGMLQARKEKQFGSKDSDDFCKQASDVYRQFDKDNGDKGNIKAYNKGYNSYMRWY